MTNPDPHPLRPCARCGQLTRCVILDEPLCPPCEEGRFIPPASCSSQCFREGHWMLSPHECGCYDDWLRKREQERRDALNRHLAREVAELGERP